ncbi:MAG: efflux transporter periplasmic adaptor subunit [Flavobacteriaceae bacterium]|nr:efflux transporter periplasmic adaptor subunit [Flavobacteriaceae bacterium]|tara:strand:- start:8602 stop:9735 length:1134 start_codon:yes stop_codon:yes gene_type:complete
MKKKYLIFLSLVLITSCGEAKKESVNLLKLKTEKNSLIKQIDSLSEILNSVELNISKLDTNKRLPSVTVFNAKEKLFQHFIEVQGTVEADQSVELYPENSGSITNIYVKEGQKVYKGQTLIQIDNSVLKSSIVELETQFELAKTTFERQKRLWDQNIGSEIQFLQAKAQKEGLENSLESLKAQEKKLKISAPFSGTIDEMFAKIGGLAAPMIPAVRLVNLNQIHVESEVTETYLKYIRKGTQVELFFPSIGKNVSANVSQVGNYINPNNRSFKVRVDINNQNNELKANLLADIKINDFKEIGIVIPAKLIQKDREGKQYVYTVIKEKGNYLSKKNYIKAGMTYETDAFIIEGIQIDDLIVDKGARLIKANEMVILAQ